MKKSAGTGFGRSQNMRKQQVMTEIAYIIITVVIVVLAVFAFFFQDNASFLYPIIFVLAAVTNLMTGVRYMKRDQHNKRHTVPAILFFIIAGALLVMAVIGLLIML